MMAFGGGWGRLGGSIMRGVGMVLMVRAQNMGVVACMLDTHIVAWHTHHPSSLDPFTMPPALTHTHATHLGSMIRRTPATLLYSQSS